MSVLEWLVLLPLWRRLIESPGGRIAAAIGTGVTWLVIIIVIAIASGGGGDDDDEAATALETPTPQATAPTEEPTEPSAPEPTPEPTVEPTPETTPTPIPPPEPVILEGFGQTATDAITPPASVSVATFTHSGSSNFIVHTFQAGEEDFLINVIGSYQGSRPIFGEEPITFDIDADGAWTLRLEALGIAASASFSGVGDAVSGGILDVPSTGAWEVSHDGQSNFAVWLHCADGSDLIQNEIGVVSGSTVIDFGSAPCLWEVEADGTWSLQPR
ncbi:MAG: hypothetical protein IH864_00255 [Chloroflexi bacterium]|nr:hypothetical protein [Chloroflexota bacterium]